MSFSPNMHSEVEDENGIDRSLDEIMGDGKDEPNSRANEVCRDFKRGYCPRGERCYFQHVSDQHSHSENELATPGIITTLGGRALCRDYMRGHCRRGVDCPFFHIQGGERCRDFDRMQDCRRGNTCPFLHVSIQPSRSHSSGGGGSPTSPGLIGMKPPPFERERMAPPPYDPTMIPPPYYRGGAGPGPGPLRFDPYNSPIPKQNFGEFRPPIVKTELCRDWARYNGDCPRGVGCQYLHGNPGDICRDFTRRGRCYRGDNCPFAHHVTAESKPEVCMKFLRGECTRGQNCPYIHSTHGMDQQQPQQPEACRKFLRGECERVNCRYFHPPPFAAEEGTPHDYVEAEFA